MILTGSNLKAFCLHHPGGGCWCDDAITATVSGMSRWLGSARIGNDPSEMMHQLGINLRLATPLGWHRILPSTRIVLLLKVSNSKTSKLHVEAFVLKRWNSPRSQLTPERRAMAAACQSVECEVWNFQIFLPPPPRFASKKIHYNAEGGKYCWRLLRPRRAKWNAGRSIFPILLLLSASH